VDGFWGRECASYEEYLAGSCDKNRAVPMGDPVPRKYMLISIFKKKPL